MQVPGYEGAEIDVVVGAGRPDEVVVELDPAADEPAADPEEEPTLDAERPECIAVWSAWSWPEDARPLRRGCVVPSSVDPIGWSWRTTRGHRIPRELGDWITIEDPSGTRRWLRATAPPPAPLQHVPTGTLRGHVSGVDALVFGDVWLVAFRDDAPFAETLAAPDGTFELRDLPIGTWGLCAGDESPATISANVAASGYVWGHDPADPWRAALRVELTAGATVTDLVVPLRRDA